MAVTLAQAKLNVQDDLQMGVIDEFAKSSFLLNNLTFDDVVSPTGGGTTLTYGYTRLKTQPVADFREVNKEYAKHEVEKQRINVDLKIFGGAFDIDRVIADMGGIVGEVELQMKQKIKAASALFNDTAINGDSAVNAKSFDGLDKALTGSVTEFVPGMAINLSTSDMIDKNYKVFLDLLDEFLMGLDGTPSFIAGNTTLIARIRACARRSAQYQTGLNQFGQNVEFYDTIALVDLGAKPGTNDPVVSIDGTSGETSLYVARLAMDGLHGIAPTGNKLIRSWLPDFTTAGAVKTGEVEMLAAIALKATKAAGVFRKIKVK